MAEKKRKTTPRTAEEQIRAKKRNILLALILFLVIVGVIVGGMFLIRHALFTANSRFTLRYVTIRCDGPGYWQHQMPRLLAFLKLEPSRSNLWALNLRQLRKKILTLPAVADCSVRRILPDSLEITLSERIPRASLGNPGSPYVVLPRGESMRISGTPPVISGLPRSSQVRPGERCEAAAPAVNLLLETIRNYPDIQLIHMNLANPEKLQCALMYRGRYLYNVTLPVKGDYGYLLGMLQSAIIGARRNGDQRNDIDVSFNGQVVLRTHRR